jgi:diacylglycerol kinase family enzyme
LLIINPRAGNAGLSAEELAAAAERRGVDVRTLQPGEDAAEIAASADADPVGIAGGDGSLAPVAAVAVERGLSFVCIPYGKRNHFARDLGLDQDNPLACLEAFDGRARTIDVARVNGRVFLNNVSLGDYASLVHRREQHRRRREALAGARALAALARRRPPLSLLVDGRHVSARVVLVSNNAYELDLFSLGARKRIDEGRLHLYVARGWLPTAWQERSGERFCITADGRSLTAAIDGEPAELPQRLDFTIEPRALRVLAPHGAPG